MSRDKFLDTYAEFFPKSETAKAFYSHLFRAVDSNQSGEIDFREFLTVCIR